MELKEIIDYQVSVTPTNIIEVVTITSILKNGVQVGHPSYHRYALQIGSDLSNQPEKVKLIAQAVWTPEVVYQYNKSLEEAEDI